MNEQVQGDRFASASIRLTSSGPESPLIYSTPRLPQSPDHYKYDREPFVDDRWRSKAKAPLVGDYYRPTYGDARRASREPHRPRSSVDPWRPTTKPSSIDPARSPLASTSPEKIADQKPFITQDSDGFDFSKVPKGPKIKGLVPVSEFDKKFPHIWISANAVPPDPHTPQHLRRMLKRAKFEYLQVDASGYYIGFKNTETGRSDLNACYDQYHGGRLFQRYILEMRCFPNGQHSAEDETRPESLHARLDRSATEQSNTGPARDEITTGTSARDLVESELEALPPDHRLEAPQDVAVISPSILGTRTSVLQSHDDSSSTESGKTSSELSTNSQGRSRRCQICKKASPLDTTSLFACSTCHRRFHKGCHKPMISCSSEVWQCYLCEKTRTKLNASPPSVGAEQEPEGDYCERPSKRAKLDPMSTKTSPLRLELSRNQERHSVVPDHGKQTSGPDRILERMTCEKEEEQGQTRIQEIPETPTNGNSSSLTTADEDLPFVSPALDPPSSSSHSGGLGNSNRALLRPDMYYHEMIALALLASPDHRLPAAEIYKWVAENIPGYKLKSGNWQTGISVTLTQKSKESPNALFIRQPRNPDEPGSKGKGGWWALRKGVESQFSRLNPNIERPIGSDSKKKTSYAGADDAHFDQDQNEYMLPSVKKSQAEDPANDRDGSIDSVGLAHSFPPMSRRADTSIAMAEEILTDCRVAVPETPASLRATTIEMGGIYSDRSFSSSPKHLKTAQGYQDDAGIKEAPREIPDSMDPVLADLLNVGDEHASSSPAGPRSNIAAAEDLPADRGSNVGLRHQGAESWQDRMQSDSPVVETGALRSSEVDVSVGKPDKQLPHSHDSQDITMEDRHDSAVEAPYDRERLAATLIKAYVQPKFTSLSLYEGRPEYRSNAPEHDTEAKLREIKFRPTRKQVFGKTAFSRLSGNGLGTSLKTADLGQVDARSFQQAMQTIPPDTGSDQDQFIDEFGSLDKLLGLPSLVVPMIHENQLAFRDGTQVSLLVASEVPTLLTMIIVRRW